MRERLYAAALEAYLDSPSELALSQACDLGRRALADGLGVLDLAAAHQLATEDLVRRRAPQDPWPLLRAADEFLRETLSPFETRFREQREGLEAVKQELESFSYSVSHDLRAPLRSIDGFSAALLEDCGDRLDDEGRRHLGRVRAAAARMSQQIDDLLMLARLTRGELHRAPVDLAALARTVIERLASCDPSRRVAVTIADHLPAEGDARLLTVLLEQLLGNAWKFTSKSTDARIEVGVSDAGGRRSYFVSDNGAGFDLAQAAKLFGAFQRLHPPGEFEGNGIGLAIVRRVVHRHGGQAWAEGRVGHGAIFYFTLG